HILGYRRMTDWINHFNQTHFSRKRIHRIMKKLGIHSVIRKKKKKYNTSKPEETAENKLARDFYAAAPNQKWATDVTEFKIPETGKKLYLSAILDLYDRYPVAFVISGRNDNQLVFKTFDKAISTSPDARPIFHSDRGFQYTSRVFQKKLEDNEMIQSMSRVGHCIDNGPTEGFWGIIKSEMYQMYEITDEMSLRNAIRDYMRFYRDETPAGGLQPWRHVALRRRVGRPPRGRGDGHQDGPLPHRGRHVLHRRSPFRRHHPARGDRGNSHLHHHRARRHPCRRQAL